MIKALLSLVANFFGSLKWINALVERWAAWKQRRNENQAYIRKQDKDARADAAIDAPIPYGVRDDRDDRKPPAP